MNLVQLLFLFHICKIQIKDCAEINHSLRSNNSPILCLILAKWQFFLSFPYFPYFFHLIVFKFFFTLISLSILLFHSNLTPLDCFGNPLNPFLSPLIFLSSFVKFHLFHFHSFNSCFVVFYCSIFYLSHIHFLIFYIKALISPYLLLLEAILNQPFTLYFHKFRQKNNTFWCSSTYHTHTHYLIWIR